MTTTSLHETNSTPQPGANKPGPRRDRPGMVMAGAVTVGITLVGFLSGIGASTPAPRRSVPPQPRHQTANTEPTAGEPTVETIRGAVSYRDMARGELSPNADWTSDLASLRFTPPELFASVERTTQMTSDALAERATSRAFDGAPPVIPHPVPQQSAESCRACHDHGIRFAGRFAPRISHDHFTSCTQCHVEAASSAPFANLTDDPAVANSFTGRHRSGPGTRAMAGAPPTIPHTTWLRDDCMSCHGLTARPGLRTTHPWLQNCVQCHVETSPFEPNGFASRPGG